MCIAFGIMSPCLATLSTTLGCFAVMCFICPDLERPVYWIALLLCQPFPVLFMLSLSLILSPELRMVGVGSAAQTVKLLGICCISQRSCLNILLSSDQN